MSLWSWLKGFFGKKEPPVPPTSLVFLLREPRYLDKAILCQVVQRAFGVDLSNSGPDSTEFVVSIEGCPTHYVQYKGRIFLLHNFPVPYFSDKDKVANGIPELRLRNAVLEHQAWLSVDATSPPWATDDPYLSIGKLLAELANEDCLAIIAPAFQAMNVWDPAKVDTLWGDNPLDAVRQSNQVPVIRVADDDPLMIAAVAEARRRWPEFVAEFELRRPGWNFAAKAPFREGDFLEVMWFKVTAVEGDSIYGTIDNDPVDLKKIRHGSRVKVPVKDLNDWVFTEGNDHQTLKGGFTIEAVRKAGEQKRE